MARTEPRPGLVRLSRERRRGPSMSNRKRLTITSWMCMALLITACSSSNGETPSPDVVRASETVQKTSEEPKPTPDASKTPEGPEPTPDQSKSAINGDCNAQGNGNTVNCIRDLPQQIGDVRLAANFSYSIWAFDGPPKELPKAPDYKAHETRFHCDAWGSWLWENGFYSVAPGGEVFAVSGEADQVAIVGFKALVHSRRKVDLRRLTYIACNDGGGTSPATPLTTTHVRRNLFLSRTLTARHRRRCPLPR